MTTTVPLTTAFTTASDCFQPTYTLSPGGNDTSVVTSNLQGYTVATFIHGFTSSCYPEGFYDVVFNPPNPGGVVVSPGWCGSGFNTASKSTGLSATTAFCCPGSASLATPTTARDQKSFDCSNYVGTAGEVTLISSGQTSAYSVDRGEVYQVARGFAVTYVQSDQALLASLSASPTYTVYTISALVTPTTTGLVASRVRPGSTTTLSGSGIRATAASNTSPSQSEDVGLSTGAKAGIGAGVGVAALIFIMVGISIVFRRRKRNSKYEPNLNAHNSGFRRFKSRFEKPELSGEGTKRAELDAADVHEALEKEQPAEMNGDYVRAELEGHWNGWEAPTNAPRRQ